MRVNYAIVFVSDMKRAVSFYREVLGLPLKFESPGWTEFATDGATLALHASEGLTSERNNPSHDSAGRCRPGLSVPNLDEFHRRWSKGACLAFRSRQRSSVLREYDGMGALRMATRAAKKYRKALQELAK